MAIVGESGRVVVVVGLSIVRPTTKQWGKVEVGLGFGNINNECFWVSHKDCRLAAPLDWANLLSIYCHGKLIGSSLG